MSATSKHLVLEGDVHQSLKRKKDLTGLSIREIGNAVLRSSMEETYLSEVVGNILVKTGRLARNEYQEVLEQAALETKRTRMAGAPPVSRTQQGTLTSGSWEIANIVSSDNGLYQILECWARNADRQPMGAHTHTSDEFLIVLKGRSSITMCGTQFVLGPQSVIQIPAGCIHAAAPLDASAYLIAILTPAVPEYHFDRS